MLLAGLEYKLFNKGPVTSNIAEGGAFWYSDRSVATPDLQFHLCRARAWKRACLPCRPVPAARSTPISCGRAGAA